MELFYTADIAGDHFILSEEESKHVIRVLRFRKGDTIFLTNGKGDLFKTEVEEANPKACALKITEKTQEYGKRDYTLHLAVAPPKNTDRFEWFLEKATEIGVDIITPVLCEHSERRDLKTERLKKVMVAAMKQSLKTYLPELRETVPFMHFINTAASGQKFICSAGAGKNTFLKNFSLKDALIMIGPEGDFSNKEIFLAEKNNFQTVSLGESRLRTETAGVVAAAIASAMNQ